jgi:hypothetical protein
MELVSECLIYIQLPFSKENSPVKAIVLTV